jgi:DNA primase catalytic core
MGRIPEEELERLKQIPIQAIAEARGVQFTRRGSDLVALCPFHKEETPSFIVSPDKNLWHCLGACGRGGSVLDLVMLVEAVSFRQAVELLRAGYPAAGAAPGPLKPIKHSTVRKMPPAVELDATDQELLEQVMAYYQRRLLVDRDALAYLQKRGLGSSEMIEHFGLGYSDRSLCYGLPEKNRKAGAEIRSRLQKLGILRDSGHELFWGSIVVPIRDEHGRVVSAYGRKVRDDLKPGTAYHLNLDGQLRGVFNVQALEASKRIILCEAIFDALTFWCAGLRNVVATRGAGAFTAEYMDAFVRARVEQVLLAFDRDQAGEREAEALAPRLRTAGMEVYRIEFPWGMDANSYALTVKPARKSLELLVRKALWVEGQRPQTQVLEVQAAAQQRQQQPVDPEPGPTESIEHSRPQEPERIALPKALSPWPCSEPPEPAFSSAAEPPAASSQKASHPLEDVEAKVEADQIVLYIADRRYRIRGLGDNSSHNQMKVNILASRAEGFHFDTLDLYQARARASFVKQAAAELHVKDEIVHKDLGRVLLKLEELQDEQLRKSLTAQAATPAMSEPEREEALLLLRDPRLLERILSDFERCGVIGEETNKLVGYLAAVSRKLERPLAIMIQSSSAAGKSWLMDALLSFVPDEELVKYSAMTGQSLYYMGPETLKHKVLAISEGEGAERASYALKLLQSEGELSIASTGKDPLTGKLVTHEYRVAGPVMLLWTTTAIEVDEELMNRCLVLTVNEGREQTQAIHRRQRHEETLEGLLEHEERSELRKLHQNAQRLLRPLRVANPYANQLTFLDDRTRLRRDHLKYLRLIRAIALLHQYQRPLRTMEHRGKRVQYIEVERSDIALANRLASEVLGRSLDELPPQTRRLLLLVEQMVKDSCARLGCERSDLRFRAREVREYTGWGNSQLKVHLARLVEMEYLLVHRGGRGQSFVYELLYDGGGKDGSAHLCGLIDLVKLDAAASAQPCDQKRPAAEERQPGKDEQQPGPGRTEAGQEPAPGRTEPKADANGAEGLEVVEPAGKGTSGIAEQLASSPQACRNGASSGSQSSTQPYDQERPGPDANQTGTDEEQPASNRPEAGRQPARGRTKRKADVNGARGSKSRASSKKRISAPAAQGSSNLQNAGRSDSAAETAEEVS